jgi:hypothetical protein
MEEIGGDKLVYTGAAETLTLRGPSSQILKIPWLATTRIQWAPVDRRVAPLEIRANVLSWQDNVWDGSAPFGLPIVRMRVTFGHAQQTIYEPLFSSATNPIVSQLNVFGMPIAARGFLARITARELTIDLSFVENNVERPSVSVLVSVQPVEGMHMPRVGADERQVSLAGGVSRPASAFPVWASEWKVFDRAGQPYEEGEKTLQLFDLQGRAFQMLNPDPPPPDEIDAVFDASLFADWSPISLDMFAWRYAHSFGGDPGVRAAYR